MTTPASFIYLASMGGTLIWSTVVMLAFERAQGRRSARSHSRAFVSMIEIVYPASLGLDEVIAHLVSAAPM